jgi:glycosyltransferase involved in cell wall biosynthesis
MPTLNEIEGLKAVLPKIDRTLFEQIIVVDGGSTDGTAEFSLEQGLTVLRQPGRGIPDAEEYAFAHCTCDGFVLFTPDGNSLPELLSPLCEKLTQGFDLVVASRYLDGAQSLDDDWLTSIGNRMFVLLANFFFRSRYTDVLVGLRAYTRDAIEKMGLPAMSHENRIRQKFFYMNSWELGSSIRAARLKLKVAEIPGSEPKRIGGQRKLSIIKNGSGALLQILHDFFLFR